MPIKYVAELTHVREVSLTGTADLDFWNERLKNEDLVPAEKDGKAQVLIVAADSKFRGIRFRELSFSVLVAPDEANSERDAAFLVQAFNSCRFFAFWERTFFRTPYHHGDVRVSASVPARIELIKDRMMLFRAEMQADASAPERQPTRIGEEGWEGPIFLPSHRRKSGRSDKVFFARIAGHTQTYPFVPAMDSLVIQPSAESGILAALIDSHFTGEEWAIREDATHAKSKTYKRSEFPRN